MADNQIIIAFSGRKGAGKNTIGSFVGEYAYESLMNKPASLDDFFFECSFADSLKEFCINVLGLPEESCYGTDEQKNAPTNYDWETAPYFLRWKFADEDAKRFVAEGLTQNELMDTYHRRLFEPYKGGHANMTYATGKMSGREIMQMFGTDLIRQTFGNVWAEATIRLIERKGRPLSIITDNRFPNEIETVLKQRHGYVIRLTRSPYGLVDAHPSESALDHYDWNKSKCFILDNADMTIDEQNEAVKPILNQIME